MSSGNKKPTAVECKTCGKLLDSETQLNKHYFEDHNSIKPYKCKICGLEMRWKNNLRSHMIRLHCKVKDFHCYFCRLGCSRFLDLNRHITRHTLEVHNKCTICLRNFSDSSSLKKHTETHNISRKIYTCEHCNKTVYNLNDHINTIHREVAKLHKCTFCDKLLKHAEGLQHHIRVHTKEKPFKCEFCLKEFSTSQEMNRHHNKAHSLNSQPKVKCDLCLKYFCSQSSFKKHSRVVHLKTAKLYKCKYCEKVLTSLLILETHLRKHTGEKPYKCFYCAEMFVSTGHRERHLKVHKGIELKTYTNCYFCDKLFIKRAYVQHLQCHTNERPYRCKTCCYEFRNNAHLIRHEVQHSREMIKCDLCKMTFVSEENLKLHIKRHTNKVRDKCYFCNKKFSRAAISKHTRIHTKEKYFWCFKCGIEYKSPVSLKKHYCKIKANKR